jgi:hypothetical protein
MLNIADPYSGIRQIVTEADPLVEDHGFKVYPRGRSVQTEVNKTRENPSRGEWCERKNVGKVRWLKSKTSRFW